MVFFRNLPVIKSPIKNQINKYENETIPKETKPIKTSDSKEKAIELQDKYYQLFERMGVDGIPNKPAIQCALICIDETIQALQNHAWQNRHIISQYEAVKKEIENYEI